MNCKKCGYELKDDWNICPKCSLSIENKNEIIANENIQPNETPKVEEKQDVSNYEGKDKIYLIVFLGSIVSGILIKQISGLAFIAALITIVTGYIQYPENRAIKILFWLFLAGIVLYIIFIILMLFMCANAVSNYSCPGA